jgi:hypothetical protein
MCVLLDRREHTRRARRFADDAVPTVIYRLSIGSGIVAAQRNSRYPSTHTNRGDDFSKVSVLPRAMRHDWFVWRSINRRNAKMATRKKKGKKARPMFDDGPGPHVKRAKKKASKKK